uniref:Uncharacterized protein n=1 Tax=Oryza sativa subsp. japonica TaxID=39947 RepID=Q5Z8S3_ORYSJ|nr:hypothetical protein [Oryza sativa Japonica Group]
MGLKSQPIYTRKKYTKDQGRQGRRADVAGTPAADGRERLGRLSTAATSISTSASLPALHMDAASLCEVRATGEELGGDNDQGARRGRLLAGKRWAATTAGEELGAGSGQRGKSWSDGTEGAAHGRWPNGENWATTAGKELGASGG